MKLTGKVSWFGGPDDTGVAPDEGLAFIFEVEDAPHLFLPAQPPGTTGLARRLDAYSKFYIACRWDYDAPNTSKADLLKHVAFVRAVKTGRQTRAYPADWGPNENTGRVADLSPALMHALGITTDDEVEIIYPYDNGEEQDVAIHRVAISAGHGAHVPGTEGVNGLQEFDEAKRVMRAVAEQLRRRGIGAVEFADETSTSIDENLDTIVDWHNAQQRDLDVSCHFNSSDNHQGHGVEVLYLTQEALAAKVSAAIATNGLIDRGAVYRDGLAFLNGTDMPAIMLETIFLDNEDDAVVYKSRFTGICASIATAIAGAAEVDRPERPPRPPRPEPPSRWPVVAVAITVPDGVELELSVNGEELLT